MTSAWFEECPFWLEKNFLLAISPSFFTFLCLRRANSTFSLQSQNFLRHQSVARHSTSHQAPEQTEPTKFEFGRRQRYFYLVIRFDFFFSEESTARPLASLTLNRVHFRGFDPSWFDKNTVSAPISCLLIYIELLSAVVKLNPHLYDKLLNNKSRCDRGTYRTRQKSHISSHFLTVNRQTVPYQLCEQCFFCGLDSDYCHSSIPTNPVRRLFSISTEFTTKRRLSLAFRIFNITKLSKSSFKEVQTKRLAMSATKDRKLIINPVFFLVIIVYVLSR